ncbi:relaxin receptor 1 isoform X3 [Latimeria chalumnae]|uniref:relaxin receptor 1 isoform X3 n=1 Tax=Latimeria chalumnae TaxID=7897 RepID=UPI00313EA5EB
MIVLLLCVSLAKEIGDVLATLETYNSAMTCSLGYFPCGNITKCLPQLLHCNGVDDCGNLADEENCGDNNGWSHLFDIHYRRLPSYAFETKLQECLLGFVHKQCLCHGQELDCDGARIETIPSVSTDVTMMSLQRNLLRTLVADGFKKYQNLRRLYLQQNKIQNVSVHAFRGLYNLTKLYLSHNKIRNLKPGVFSDLHKLEWLVLLNNSLTHLPDKPLCQHMPKLNWLDFEGNQIQNLRNVTFSACNQLTVLVLRKNKIDVLDEHTFTPLHELGELDLSVNKIQRLHSRVFKDLSKLLQLNLSYNPLEEIQVNQFDRLLKLKSLSIEGIDIVNIQRRMFDPLKNLSHIYFKKFQYCGYAPHVRSCKPKTDGISSLENLLANVMLRVFVWVVSAVTCFGNIFVICMRPYIRSENRLHTMSIMSLCCADCLMGIYLFVIGAFDLKYRGEYNQHAQLWMDSMQCQLIGSLAMLSTEVSVLILTYLTLEKYICIVYPFQCLTPGKRRTVATLIAIWIVGFVIAFIPLVSKDFFQNYYGTNGVCFPLHSEQTESTGAQIYSVIIFLGLNLLAFIIIVFSYASMFYSILQTGAMVTEISAQVKKEMTIAKRFFFIVFTDALCWIPIFVLKVLSLLQVEIPGSISSWVVIFVLPINSALNPILYTLTTRPFKEMIRQVWHNYQQKKSFSSNGGQKVYAPSFIWLEMWPLQETTQTLAAPGNSSNPSEVSIITHTAKLNSYI